HAKGSKLGGAQRTNAGSAKDVHTPRHRPQDLLVPDRWSYLEISVDDADGRRTLVADDLVELAHPGRRAPFDLRMNGTHGRRQRRSREDDGMAHRLAACRARGPG